MKERFSESALLLSGLVPRLLGWPPGAFWSATPSELAAILATEEESTAPLTRDELNALLERERNG